MNSWLNFYRFEKMNFTREQLYNRHRLSHQQIDDVLGENQAKLYIQDKIKQLADLKVFFELTDALRSQGIDFLNLKGPVLSQRIYGDPTYRYYRDFDIMVASEDAGKAFGILVEKGFRPNYFDWPESKQKQNAILKYINQTSFYHPEHEITVELHWKLFHREYMERNKEEKLVQDNTNVVLISGREFKTLSSELDLVFLVIHGGLHAWARLKWLLDIQEYNKRLEMDQEKLKKLVAVFHAEPYFALANSLLQKIFDSESRVQFLKDLKPETVNFCLSRINSESPKPYDDQKSFLGYYRYLWELSTGWEFVSSLFRFSYFSREEVEHSWLPLHPGIAMGLRIWKKVFGKTNN
jgi:hypothetical protein